MTFNAYRIIWMVVHFVYSLTHFLIFICINVRKSCEELLSKSTSDELGLISHHVKLLVKVPSHLVLIIGNENASFGDLANIVVWCLAAGISFVTFYDYNGVLKLREAELIKALAKRLGSNEHMNNIVWGKSITTNGHVTKNGTNGSTNGYNLPKVTVNVLSLDDGKGSLVDVTNTLCDSVLLDDLKPSDISQKLIDALLDAKLCIPEPELAFYCGNTCSSYGLLPWHIRVTEFLPLQSHHNIKAIDFIRLLNKYGDCKQRFGK